jgi:hypothetical protein
VRLKKTIIFINLLCAGCLVFYLFYSDYGPWEIKYEPRWRRGGDFYQGLETGFILSIAGLMLSSIAMIFYKNAWYFLQLVLLFLFLYFMKSDPVQRTILGYYPGSNYRILKEYKSWITDHAPEIKQLTDFMKTIEGDSMRGLEFRCNERYCGFSNMYNSQFNKLTLKTPFNIDDFRDKLKNFSIRKINTTDCYYYEVSIPREEPLLWEYSSLYFYPEGKCGYEQWPMGSKGTVDYRTNLFLELWEEVNYMLDDQWMVRFCYCDHG